MTLVQIIIKIVVAVVIAVLVTIACSVLGGVIVDLKASIAVTIGDALKNYGQVIGVAVGLLFLFWDYLPFRTRTP